MDGRMEQRTQIQLIDEIRKRISNKETELGEKETHWLVSDYYDSEQYTKEFSMIMNQPLIVAHGSEIPKVGDYLSKTVMGVPIIIIRTPNKSVNVFVNACKHRGASLVVKDQGRIRKNFICPYHGWAYDMEGKLCNVPDKDRSFPNLEMNCYPLSSLPVSERHGFIWVRLNQEKTEKPAVNVESFLGPQLDQEFKAYQFDQYTFYRKESWQMKFNWKCGVEQFLENYHFAFLHKDSTNWLFLHNLAICDQFQNHIRGIAPKRSVKDLFHQPVEEWDLRPNATILYTIFPLSTFFIEKSHLSLLQIFPESPETSLIEVTHIVQEDCLSKRSFWEENIRLFKAAIMEDLETCETMQIGFKTQANKHLIFGRNEVALAQYRQCINKSLEEDKVKLP